MMDKTFDKLLERLDGTGGIFWDLHREAAAAIRELRTAVLAEGGAREAVAWSSRSKTGLLRGIREGAPTETDIAIAESDGDTMVYYCIAPIAPPPAPDEDGERLATLTAERDRLLARAEAAESRLREVEAALRGVMDLLKGKIRGEEWWAWERINKDAIARALAPERTESAAAQVKRDSVGDSSNSSAPTASAAALMEFIKYNSAVPVVSQGEHNGGDYDMNTIKAREHQEAWNESMKHDYPSPLLPGLDRAAESIERRKAEWAALDAVIQTYSDDYEYGEEGYTPSRIELAICYDFLQGLIANDDFLAAIAQVYPVRSTFTAAISRLKGEGSES